MFRLFMLGMIMLGMVGCATKATGPSLQEQVDNLKLDVVKAQEAQTAKDAEQDAAIGEINSKIDGLFRKGR